MPWVKEMVMPWVKEMVMPWVKEMVMPWVMERGTGAETVTATHCTHGNNDLIPEGSLQV
jgi:hypothetical protein